MAEKPVILFPGTCIVLPESGEKGTVVETADGTCLRVGDIVLFLELPEVEVVIDGVTHRIVRTSDVLGWYSVAPDPEPIPPSQ